MADKVGAGDTTALTTRIPKRLHHAVKVHCAETERSIIEFVVEAMRERLRQDRAARRAS